LVVLVAVGEGDEMEMPKRRRMEDGGIAPLYI
jgi:hypothetical protein